MAVSHSIAKRRLVHGIGINDADYVVFQGSRANRVSCPFYDCWVSMLKRCYSEKYQSSHATYKDCKVCDEWHRFMAFKAWMELQDWKDKQLDKDLIGDGKLYSPDNCVFVSRSLNQMLNSGISGEYPIGVCRHKSGRFVANVKTNGDRKYLGLFPSPEEAHSAWRTAKLEIAQGYLASETNPRVRYAIECGIAKLSQ